MRITVIGATGMVGARVTDESVRRGHQITAISRNPTTRNLPAAVITAAADAADPVALGSLLAATDAAVLCIRPASGAEAGLASTTTAVLDVAAATGTRVLVVGGAGPLRSPNNPELLVVDDPEHVPAEWRSIAIASTEQLNACHHHSDADWTYLSPPALLVPGERTGDYRRGTETLLVAEDGSSRISVEDLAVAVLDEIEVPSGPRRLTVASRHM